MYNTSHSDLRVSQNRGCARVMTFDPCVRICVNKKAAGNQRASVTDYCRERVSTKQPQTAVTGSAAQSPDGVLFTAD